jgi:hypothetical protein
MKGDEKPGHDRDAERGDEGRENTRVNSDEGRRIDCFWDLRLFIDPEYGRSLGLKSAR